MVDVGSNHGDHSTSDIPPLSTTTRERREWSDTPIARIFVNESEWSTLKPRAYIESARANVVATLAFVAKLTNEREKLEEVCTGYIMSDQMEEAEGPQQRIAEIVNELQSYPKDVHLCCSSAYVLLPKNCCEPSI